MKQYDITIVGGGASGMAAAIAASRSGASVCLIERMETAGKKILATGNGRCNYTNLSISTEYYHSRHTRSVARVLETFGSREAMDFFRELGVEPVSRNGYVYPRSFQAASVRDALTAELDFLGVDMMTCSRVVRVSPVHNGYALTVKTYPLRPDAGKKKRKPKPDLSAAPDIRKIRSGAVILACGGKAAENLGSDGSGYLLAKELGHSVRPVVPALNSLLCKEDYFKQIAGVRAEGTVRLFIDGILRDSQAGEIQMTENGISGIPVFQLCSLACRGLLEKKKVRCVLDFFPEWSEAECEDFFTQRLKRLSGRSEQAFFNGLLPEKLMALCAALSGFHPDGKNPSGQQKESLKRFVRLVTHFPATIVASRGFDQAQACSGGVLLNEVRMPYCESVYHPGLYIIGELLDADGACGGYNLHWAWATGILSGTHAAKRKRDPSC